MTTGGHEVNKYEQEQILALGVAQECQRRLVWLFSLDDKKHTYDGMYYVEITFFLLTVDKDDIQFFCQLGKSHPRPT